jgi:hypothetical protein
MKKGVPFGTPETTVITFPDLAAVFSAIRPAAG